MSDLGLKRGTVKLLPYDESWAELFDQEKALLLQAFGSKILDVQHIGSTAIPGLVAKPIIDINVAIKSLDDIDEFIEPLIQLGYEHMQERRFMDRHFFPKGPEVCRTHHLNLVEIDSQTGWINPLLFRDYLIEHQDTHLAYAKLKTELADQYSDNREAYTEAKSALVREIINRAIAEQQRI